MMRSKNGWKGPITAQFDHWFDGSQVLVRVLIRCEKGAETPNADTLVTAALRGAADCSSAIR
jgi:hypothetical protein